VASILMRIPVGGGAGGEQAFMVAEVDEADVTEFAGGGLELAADDDDEGGPGRRLVRSSRSLAQALDGLSPALGQIMSRLRTATLGKGGIELDEIKVEFGLKLGGETGLIFAKGTAEATLNVSVTWSSASDATGGGHAP
jgi:Trypsin-co-occurring domain 1